MHTTELARLAVERGIDLAGWVGPGPLDGLDPVAPPKGGSTRTQPRRDRPSYYAAPDDLPWCAARYSFAADRSVYWPLWYGLLYQVRRIAERECWPAQVRSAAGALAFYHEQLAALVLDADANRALFVAARALYAIYMRIEERTWAEQLEPRYRTLQGCYERWLGVARGQIQGWLSEPEPVCAGGSAAERSDSGRTGAGSPTATGNDTSGAAR